MRKRVDYHSGYWIRFTPQEDYTVHYNVMSAKMDKPIGGILK